MTTTHTTHPVRVQSPESYYLSVLDLPVPVQVKVSEEGHVSRLDGCLLSKLVDLRPRTRPPSKDGFTEDRIDGNVH